MPASVHVTRGQLETLVTDYGGDVIFQEMPRTDNDIEVWVLDDTHSPDSHRNVVLDSTGHVLSDMELRDRDA